MILWIETDYSPSVPLQLSIYLPLTLILSLVLLQPVKGAVVGVQWALRMHGFDEQNPEPYIRLSQSRNDNGVAGGLRGRTEKKKRETSIPPTVPPAVAARVTPPIGP